MEDGIRSNCNCQRINRDRNKEENTEIKYPNVLEPKCTPDQVAQSSIQPGLEHCQGGGSNSFSGQPGPVFHSAPLQLWKPQIGFISFTLRVKEKPL